MVSVAKAIEMIRALNMKDSPEVIEKLTEASEGVVAEAKRYCTPGDPQYWKAPYDEREPHPLEHMRDMISHEITSDSSGMNSKIFVRNSAPGESHHYALYVHTGTYDYKGLSINMPIGLKGMPPRPVIPDAIKARERQTRQLIQEGVNNHIRRVLGK